MKRAITFIIFSLILISFASAEITIMIDEEPNEVYNLGDFITVPITISTTHGVLEEFKMDLICGTHQKISFFENGLKDLQLPGGIAKIEPSLRLTREKIKDISGTCVMIGTIGDAEPARTNEFEISSLINIQSKIEEIEFNPGESILVKGSATKANGQDVGGFINLKIVSGNESGNINKLETIGNGIFSINVTFPEKMKAGSYLVKLDAYETDLNGIETNKGFMNYNIIIKQVPTNLEIAFETNEIEPGTNLKVKTILHDQTGEKIDSTSIITIKKSNNEILEQRELTTDKFLEFPINYNEPPANWSIIAVSNKLTKEAEFTITKKESIDVEIVNKTVLMTNTGNVVYSKETLIKIGNNSIIMNVTLEIDGIQKYELKAPDGEYDVEVISDGEKKASRRVILTGKVIGVKAVKEKGIKSTFTNPLVWIFIIVVLGLIAYMVVRKGYKKSFFGKIHFKKKHKKINEAWENREKYSEKNIPLESKNPAILSLSMKGEKQPSSIISLKLKNIKELISEKGNANETLQKIVNLAEEKKAATYKTQENLFFIFMPIKTKTFKNEKMILEISQKIKEKLKQHNKLFKQKIDYGISLNYGDLIAKQEKNKVHFMSTGNLISLAKKISEISKGEILLDEKMKEKLSNNVKVEKFEEQKAIFYRIKEIKNTEDNKKFISNFIKRLESEKKK